MYTLWDWAVQQRVDGGVLELFGWICDKYFESELRDLVHGMCGGAVQQRVNWIMFYLPSGVGHEHFEQHCGCCVHCVFQRTAQQ